MTANYHELMFFFLNPASFVAYFGLMNNNGTNGKPETCGPNPSARSMRARSARARQVCLDIVAAHRSFINSRGARAACAD